MTSPIQKIRRGIQDGNWSLVCEGYNGLSGEDLSPPVPEPCDTGWVAESLEQIIQGLKRSGPVKNKKTRVVLEEPEEEPEEQPAPRRKSRKPPQKAKGGGNPDVVQNEPLRPKVEPGTGEGRPCRVEPFSLPKKNGFVDDPKKFAAEAKDDLKLAKKFKPPGARPKAKTVKATCECGQVDEVHPVFLEGADADKTYKCHKCLKKLGRSR